VKAILPMFKYSSVNPLVTTQTSIQDALRTSVLPSRPAFSNGFAGIHLNGRRAFHRSRPQTPPKSAAGESPLSIGKERGRRKGVGMPESLPKALAVGPAGSGALRGLQNRLSSRLR
jgi:hypothetical protein